MIERRVVSASSEIPADLAKRLTAFASWLDTHDSNHPEWDFYLRREERAYNLAMRYASSIKIEIG